MTTSPSPLPEGRRPAPDGPRILLVRTSALGDVVHCLPVLTALRRQLPGCRLAWVVEEGLAPLLEGHPDLDLLVAVKLRRWRRAPLSRATRDEAREALGSLRDFAPDVALDLMGNHKGALLARLSGAPRVVGLARAFRREPSSALWITEAVDPRPTPPTQPAPPTGAAPPRGPRTPSGPVAHGESAPDSELGTDPLHAVERALALLPALGVEPGPADFVAHRLAAGSEDAPLPGAATAAAGPPYAFLHPGAGWGNKVYAPQRWGAVVRRLAAEAGLETRVSVGPGEEALARSVVEASDGAARPALGRGLPELVRELRGARLALGGDTGPLHLAHALGVPVVMVMGPTDPRRHGPYGAPDNAVWETLPCSFCYKRFGETKACLEAIPAERVAARALDVLARTAGRSGTAPDDRDSLAADPQPHET